MLQIKTEMLRNIFISKQCVAIFKNVKCNYYPINYRTIEYQLVFTV